ncbi:ribonuclease HII [Candidatus Peregrinibacteria bacterium CG10_big_fil_rev_8_21_14_0_10_49_16]|nr:MAG: ribonuclease HII [Candidatus Peregrinibacteria bacterium CG10_big_fil_rev_8_21_14_0_10_49_16]
MAAACHLTTAIPESILIQDSKKLTKPQREEAFTWITQNCLYGIGIVEAKDIDNIRILSATEKAMNLAVEELVKNLSQSPSPIPPCSFYLLIDGRDKFWFDYPHSSIIDGDQKEPAISAASIVAKVTRDRLMVDYAIVYPHYDFDVHKGYGTEQHRNAIEKHDLSPIHRTTFCHTALATTQEARSEVP